MYAWYKSSQVCYAYLSDVKRAEVFRCRWERGDWFDGETDPLGRSNWFTRGWTLQELLAPSTVVFFDKDWIDIGTKASLEERISQITGIDDFINFEAACVAQKMSWVSNRKTTRVEDMAYCLLGLFDVNMPPLYGEGEKAFKRLQLEILKTVDDESIFAWDLDARYHRDSQLKGLKGTGSTTSGLLAASPQFFARSGQVRPLNRMDHENILFRGENKPFSMTNKGLHISLPLIQEHAHDNGQFLAPLRCCWIEDKDKTVRFLAIHLFKTEGSTERYSRVRRYQRISRTQSQIGGLLLLSYHDIKVEVNSEKKWAHRYIYVNEERSYDRDPPTAFQGCMLSLRMSSIRDQGYAVSQYYPLDSSCIWENSGYGEIRLSLKFFHGLVTGVLFDSLRDNIFLAIIVRTGYSPCVFVITTQFALSLEKTAALLSDIYLGADSSVKGSSSNGSAIASGGECVVSTSASSSPEQSFIGGDHALERRPPLDRMSAHLSDGTSVWASLRPVAAEDGGREYLIDIGIDQGDVLRWPAPSWVEVLMKSLKVE